LLFLLLFCFVLPFARNKAFAFASRLYQNTAFAFVAFVASATTFANFAPLRETKLFDFASRLYQSPAFRFTLCELCAFAREKALAFASRFLPETQLFAPPFANFTPLRETKFFLSAFTRDKSL
jgi:hypothetical protein